MEIENIIEALKIDISLCREDMERAEGILRKISPNCSKWILEHVETIRQQHEIINEKFSIIENDMDNISESNMDEFLDKIEKTRSMLKIYSMLNNSILKKIRKKEK